MVVRVMKFAMALSMVAATLRGQDAVEILRRSVQMDEKDNERLKDYTYLQHVVAKAYRGKKLSESDSDNETSEVMMLAGGQYQRLIEKDGSRSPRRTRRKNRTR
jgi:hypothetical protein